MKKEALFALVAVMVLVSGCAGDGGSTPPAGSYRTGSQGLVISFLANYPPPRIYDEQPFDVLVEIRNMGSFGVNPVLGAVYLSGFDPSIIPGIPTTGIRLPEIEGKTQFNPQGGYDTVEFRASVRPLRNLKVDRYTAPLQATACYTYETVGSQNICVDPDPFSISGAAKVCTPSSVSYGTQGAPVAITSVDVDAAPRVTRFRINIANVGGGTVFAPGPLNLEKCSPYSSSQLEYNEINHIMLRKVEISGRNILSTCKPEGSSIRLDPSGSAQVFCELRDPVGATAYTTPLTVELEYGYRSSVISTVEIVQTP